MSDKFNYFNTLQDSIRALASKADMLFFPDKIKKKDRDAILEDCLTVACFYMSVFHSQPPFLIDFINRGDPPPSSSSRKELGCYFTPVYIAEYIAKQTVIKLIEDIKQQELSDKEKIIKICDLKICDPACGGGVFLVVAMDVIVEECLKISPYAFTMEQLSEMALNTVYGVDLNPNAIDFSKFILSTNAAKWAMLDKINHYQQFGGESAITC